MELAQDDVALFYDIFFKLIDYTNDRYQVAPGLKKASDAEDVDPNAIMPVRDKLWESDVINRIIADNPLGFAGRELSLVASWSRRVVDDFLIFKHLKIVHRFHGQRQSLRRSRHGQPHRGNISFVCFAIIFEGGSASL